MTTQPETQPAGTCCTLHTCHPPIRAQMAPYLLRCGSWANSHCWYNCRQKTKSTLDSLATIQVHNVCNTDPTPYLQEKLIDWLPQRLK